MSAEEQEGVVAQPVKTFEFVNTAPPPDMKQRGLIFDSLSKIVGFQGGPRRRGGGKSGDNRGTYIATWGAGYHGQLGRKFVRGQKKYSAVPLQLDLECVVRQVTCGGLHTAIVTEMGDVYTWGDGRKGQLGHRDSDPSMKQTPRLVDTLDSVFVTQVACGGMHTVAVTDQGFMYSWGWGKYGQTGHGDRNETKVPKKIENSAAKGIVAVAAGNKHTVALTNKGVALSFGCSDHGQTGLGNPAETELRDIINPTVVETLQEQNVNVKSIACGSIHSCFVSDQGEVYLCGFGEFFHPNESQHFFYTPVKIDMPEPIKQVACGQSHNIALSESGNVYSWGSGDYGQLGYGIFGNLSTPRLILEDKQIASVASGRYHSLALSHQGVLYSWGCGENGQLGQNSDDNIPLPTVVQAILGSVVGMIACGEHHTAVLSSAPWTRQSDDLQEWNLANRAEHEMKQKLLKKTHRGLTKKDLQKVKEDIQKWQEDHDKKKAQTATEDEDELNRGIRAVEFDGTLTQDELNRMDERVRTMKLPSVTEKGDAADAQDEDARTNTRFPKVVKKKPVPSKSTKTALSEPVEADARAADIPSQAVTRTAFLKETAQMVRRMKAVVQDKGESQTNKALQQMVRLLVDLRKEYDQLSNIARNKAKIYDDMRKEYDTMLNNANAADAANNEEDEKLKDFQMQLQTVTIKIAETSENRKNYELNIAHLKEEDFEHFNQLKALRKQNHDNNNFFKKMNELKQQALEEKEKAETELAEFKNEIQSYQRFVNDQLIQFEQILDIVRTQNEQQEESKAVRNEKSQAKINHRIKKLEGEVEVAEKEANGLTQKLTAYDLKLRHFEDNFQKITAATGLTNPDAIVNKFFFPGEIRELLQTEIEDKQKRKEELLAEEENANRELVTVRGAFKEHTWCDVDRLSDRDRKGGVEETRRKAELDQSNGRLAYVQEGLLSIYKQLAAKQQMEDMNLDATSLWSPEQSQDFCNKIVPSFDSLLVTEQDYKTKLEARRKQAAEEKAAAAAKRKKAEEDATKDEDEA